jgi:membrane fusion protein, multidrug efflux system
MTGQEGTYVFTVDSASTAKQRPVRIARTVDSLAIVSTGVREGERVVIDGQSRLVPGAKVTIKGALQ